jgi:PBP1b-binding outer membrane lipoprotein LpoB
MKKYICLLASAALLSGCEQKETTVTNPPAEKKDGTYDFTQINTPPAETTTKEKTEVNVNSSPNPSP